MKYFLGLDCSSKSIHGTILNIEGKVVSFFACTSPEKKVDDRFYDLIHQFQNIVENLRDEYIVAIEKAIYRQNALATIGIAQVIAGVKLALKGKEIEHYVVDNKTWKRLTVGNGNCTKDQIKAYAIKRWNLPDNLVQDFYDSVGIAGWCWKECFAEYILEDKKWI